MFYDLDVSYPDCKLSYTVTDGCVEGALSLNEPASIDFFSATLLCIVLLRNDLSLVPAYDREPLALQLEDFLAYAHKKAKNGVRHSKDLESLFYQFTRSNNFLLAERVTQALKLVGWLVGGYEAPCWDDRVHYIAGFAPELDGLFDFFYARRFMVDVTDTHFSKAYGEAVIPEGESLDVSYQATTGSREQVTLPAGTVLRVEAQRFSVAYAGAGKNAGGAECTARTPDISEHFTYASVSLPVWIAPDCLGIALKPKATASGTLPLHWFTQQIHEVEYLKKDA